MPQIKELDQDHFRSFIPLELIKGSSASDVGEMKMRGIASTGSKDSEDEYLNPSGYDLSYFLREGHINWDHQQKKDPLAVIGKPTAAQVQNGDLVIDLKLFSKSETAKKVYKLQEIMQSEGMALGLSIEGKVIKRKSNNPLDPMFKHIESAMITNCAITPNPINSETVVHILKSHSAEFDNNFQEEVLKSMSAYECKDEDEQHKALSVEDSGKPLVKEDLDETIHNIAGGIDTKKKISKSEVMDRISKAVPLITNELKERVYNLIEKIDKTMDNNQVQISEEAITKAFDSLNIKEEVKVEELPVVNLADTDSRISTLEDTVKSMASNIELLVKSMTGQQALPLEDTVTELTPEVKEGQEVKTETLFAETKEQVVAEVPVVTPVVEATSTESSDIAKSITAMVKESFGGIKEQVTEIKDQVSHKFNDVGIILKSFESKLGEIEQRQREIEKTPIPTKAIQTKSYIDNIQKSVGDEVDDKPVLSWSANKAHIEDQLIKSIEPDTPNGKVKDQNVANDIIKYNTANVVTPFLKDYAKKIGLNVR